MRYTLKRDPIRVRDNLLGAHSISFDRAAEVLLEPHLGEAARGDARRKLDTPTMEELPQWKHEVPPIPHKLFNEALQVLVEFYKEHVRRDVRSGRLAPLEPFEMLRGFLVAAMQTYAAVCILLAEKRPKRLLLQAGILDRPIRDLRQCGCPHGGPRRTYASSRSRTLQGHGGALQFSAETS